MYRFVGHTRDSFGLGSAAQRLKTLMSASGILFSNQQSTKDRTAVGIIASNPDSMLAFYDEVLECETIFGFWAWELQTVPSYFRDASELVNQVWTVSSFCESSFKAANIDAVKISLPVPIPLETPRYKKKPNREQPFVVLISFDFASDWRRKNPEAGIRAYKKAFPTGSPTQLIVKAQNGKKDPRAMKFLKDIISDREDIIFIDKQFDRRSYISLISKASVYLSLHRSEGYGINMADSMAHGIPVVATGYSGNLDFMDSSSAYLIPFSMQKVNFYAGLPISSFWAEPDIDAAAKCLQELFFDESLRVEVGQAGRDKIFRDHSLSSTVKGFQERFMYER